MRTQLGLAALSLAVVAYAVLPFIPQRGGAQTRPEGGDAIDPGNPPFMVIDGAPAEQDCGWGESAKVQVSGCTRVIEANRNFKVTAQALNQRGDARASLGDDAGAFADFEAAKRLWPQYGDPYNEEAVILMQRGDAHAALVQYDAMVRASPEQPDGWDGRCWTRALGGFGLDQALKDCNRALEILWSDDVAYEDRAIVWLRLRHWDRAIADADVAIDHAGRAAPGARYIKGLAEAASGEVERGAADIAAGKAADPSHIEFLERWKLTGGP